MINDQIIFKEESEETEAPAHLGSWKVLVVDDEEQVHKITSLALSDFTFEGRPLNILRAFNSRDAQQLLHHHKDIAVVLLDVVMESDNAGLELVRFIRESLCNRVVRIVLRTGQPGEAPERSVIREYDIHDYKIKTDLTSQKLFTLMHSSLRSYRDLALAEQKAETLSSIIGVTQDILIDNASDSFVTRAMGQLSKLAHQGDRHHFALERINHHWCYLQGSLGLSENQIVSFSELPVEVADVLKECTTRDENLITDSALVIHTSINRRELYFCLQGEDLNNHFSADTLLLFSENLKTIMENLTLHKQVNQAQVELLYRLGELVETRSLETGNHVKRVARYSELLGKLANLREVEIEQLKLGAPLHDIGKIAVPDTVLNKPGALDPMEWQQMQCHPETGRDLLNHTDLTFLKAAGIIASQHHERWDGKGYPEGLVGENIHIFGRIVAIADVFDALLNERIYKKAWNPADVFLYLENQAGTQFDPTLVGLLLDNKEDFLRIFFELEDHKPFH